MSLRPGSERLPVIEVDDLWLQFVTTEEKSRSGPARLRRKRRASRTVEALQGVSFRVPVGCVFGVVGRNGAGKSTLLQTLAGILRPTAGRVTIRGRVTPLLSLGVGFNPELSGRENILMGGLAAGLSREHVEELRPDVMDFSELGVALDSPVRTYSSGMRGRLGFAIAAHLDPEVILIDEVLGAGDAQFKRKCFGKIQELCERDCTVVIVSHALNTIKKLADECLWLDGGIDRKVGPTREVLEAYLGSQGVSEENPEAMEDL